MKFKFNPITGVFDRISDAGELKEHINPLTGEFNLAPDADSYKQVFNPLTGKRNLALAAILAEVMGNGYINLTNAVKDKLLELKAYGGTEQRNLPSEYTQVAYLQSSGTQYIDIGTTVSSTDTFNMKVNWTTVGQYALFASKENTDWTVGRYLGFTYRGTNIKVWYSRGQTATSSTEPTSFTVSADTDYVMKMQPSLNKMTVNGTVYNGQGTSQTTDVFTTANNPYLFANNNVGTPSLNDRAKVYYFQVVKSDGTYRLNLIPAKRKSDNVLGMYDTVSGNFLVNKGTGTFTAGSDIVPSPATPMDIVCNNGVLKATRNLFDYRYFYDNYIVPPTSTVGRVAIKLLPNTYYTVSTNTQQSSSAAQVWTASGSDPSLFSPVTTTNGVLIDNPRTVQSDSNGYIILAIRVGTEYEIKESDFENGTVWVQIELGQIATPYAPYSSNGIYTDGTTETIEIHGKNLFDAQWRQGLYDTGNGNYNPASNNRICNVNMIQVKPSTNYTVSCPSYSLASGMRWLFYDKNKKFISALTTGATTVTTPSNARYINFYIANNLTVDTAPDLQLEKGSATTYEPYYNGGTATAEMLLALGDYKDEQSILDGAITRNVGIKILDGTEAWTKSGQGTAQDPIRFAVAGLIAFPDSDTIECLSTHYPFSGVASTGGSITPGTFNVGIYNNVHYVRFAPTDITELAQWIQYITDQYSAGTPVIIVYPLATATTESVAGQDVNIQKGNNIIEITQASIDGLPLSAKYLSI